MTAAATNTRTNKRKRTESNKMPFEQQRKIKSKLRNAALKWCAPSVVLIRFLHLCVYVCVIISKRIIFRFAVYHGLESPYALLCILHFSNRHTMLSTVSKNSDCVHDIHVEYVSFFRSRDKPYQTKIRETLFHRITTNRSMLVQHKSNNCQSNACKSVYLFYCVNDIVCFDSVFFFFGTNASIKVRTVF